MNRIRYAVATAGLSVVGLGVVGWLATSSSTVATSADPAAPVMSALPAPAATGGTAPAQKKSSPPVRISATPTGGHWPEMLGDAATPRRVDLPPRSKAEAKPYVQPFAAQPGVRPLTGRPSPTAPVKVAPSADGCDHNYGTRTQCVPWTFPNGVTDRCAWLTQHGFQHLPVVGTDRQKLDPDGNKVACD